MITLPSDVDWLDALYELLSEEEQVRNDMDYFLLTFEFGDSKRNGIMMGLRTAPPPHAKESKDFPGTQYVDAYDEHGQHKIYRYVPLTMLADFLDSTQTEPGWLSKCIPADTLHRVVRTPQAGELWTDGEDEYLVLENGFGVTYTGKIVEDVGHERLGEGIFPFRTY